MNEKLLVDVTQDCIEHGVHDDAFACPIAMAITKVKPEAEVYVLPDSVYIDFPKIYYEFKGALPESARQFIKDFDERKPVSPFSFQLDLSYDDPHD